MNPRSLFPLPLSRWAFIWLLILPVALPAVHEGRVQVVLLGDSTTQGRIPRRLAPEGPHLEQVFEHLLAGEPDLPPCRVINQGVSGEMIERLLASGRYDRDIAKLPGVDFVFIRYGLNDIARRENFDVNYPKDLRELVARLRRDHPNATLIPTTTAPYTDDLEREAPKAKRMNDPVRRLAEEENLPLFDLYPRFAREQSKAPNMLTYRRYPLAKIPERYHLLVKPFIVAGQEPMVVILDNRLDAHLGDLPGWFGDRHPNLAGYHVIADESAKFLAPLLRQKFGPPAGRGN